MGNLSVSVIITTKNRKDFVVRAIKSVFNQTLLPKEVILVDDGSDSAHVLSDSDIYNMKKSYGLDISIIYLKNLVSKGGNYSRNLGVTNSTGDIIMFLDDDDAWSNEKVATQAGILQQDVENKIGLVYTGKKFVNSIDLDKVTRKSIEGKMSNIWSGNFPGSTSGVALRRKIFDLVGGFDEKLNTLQDYDLWIRVINESRAVWDKKFNLIYTIHNSTNTQVSTNALKHIKSILRIQEKYKNEVNNLDILVRRKFLSRLNHTIARAYRRNNDPRFFKYYLKSLFLYPTLRTLVLVIYY
ncbi:hypothetical protein A6E01_17250 [Vibrio breoganii]|uniref:Glycosyltransferase 2-like domain-containing protein n=1 Tax=Vibrio breoganii TaxID=553239 RepID=A0AAN0XYD1_9VIBR|nr:glycosyltransferase family A protein [Vibrio breoganii]ANO34930.1 hypothetical protein A6E01_17250 [Vibrio breoganii]